MKRSYTKFVSRLQEIKLLDQVEAHALAHHVSLRDLYEGPALAQSVVAARRAVYRWLLSKGKGYNEIARMFDRAPSGVLKLAQGGDS